MSSDALIDALEAVCDRATFLHLVQALIDERTHATRLEEEQPEKYRWSGALEWQHSSIEGYLEGALRCVHDSEGRDDFMAEPSWRAFA
ncbi:hypothetical protein HNQ07_004691 [Deinococcus metalli]|uniref:Uncharacterized protein n=1 Tax=Deinococcus metalli TaxID=1141878 RepID=A0A7W8NRP0_9DEIO|nr:hypothetical protein [Deinococcus metalli]MBB5379176.1 hypothetical protein [Deinococcus metalli]GHF64716.1 hypothetical protein GCM10017781_45740 [Deinococcus metalli]